MIASLPGVEIAVLALLLVALMAAVRFYGKSVGLVWRGEGKVRAEVFGPLEFGLALALGTWLSLAVASAAQSPPTPLHDADVSRGAVLYLGLTAVIYGVLRWRGIRPIEAFGLRGGWSIAGKAALFLVATLPFLYLAALATTALRGPDQAGQDIVGYFRDNAARSNTRAVAMVGFYAVVIAPFCEESIFRGFLYGACKRHLGSGFAMLATSGLFAAMHLSAGAFLPLFMLALCFCLAYEATGSLLVPMGAHALFNGCNLVAMLLWPHLVAS